MALSPKIRKRHQRARDKERRERLRMKAQKAIDTLPPELAADCKLWISPPGPNDERPRFNWDIGALTHARMEAHAIAYGVGIDDVLYEIGVLTCIKWPRLYWAMKNAKINISNN